ncbi:MAG: hypothetical protein A3D44_03340 [Candidatus Staskawiczbacteria bacterium RIFCSPHIGHO2_02_FULL_42_22]|uniref:Methyltransferase type 11 domain-containing protein n=1 Tax=Candidatus Staskawiczbacteria bacterium RIFCSPHIGHO2_02_FULL_42_22 TaxID=1802207 RepID=A0A1G2I478_9BACT|nr:MAG: hypothetical protein A3D44_03340 [Candidatus Staskawiczbacteria bacterium RIFCSPHIGHO2_02_FULL_42_22]
MNEFIEKAINPYQYDSYEKGLNSFNPQFFGKIISKNLKNISQKNIVDIGSGTGWLLGLLKNLGTGSIKGVEPSLRSIKISKKAFPNISVFHGTLDNFKPKEKFHIAISIMVFEHIHDVTSAFSKIAAMMKKNGKLYIVVGDSKYFTTPRLDYKLTVKNIDKDTVVVKVRRPQGVIHDIFRSISYFTKCAKQTGFTLEKHIKVKPSQEVLEVNPKYLHFKNTVMFHLLIFKLT